MRVSETRRHRMLPFAYPAVGPAAGTVPGGSGGKAAVELSMPTAAAFLLWADRISLALQVLLILGSLATLVLLAVAAL